MTSFSKLLFVLLAVLAGWLVYDNRDRFMTASGPDADEASAGADARASGVIPDSASELTPNTTTVYKWQDHAGQWHVSNTPPGDAAQVEVTQYRSDQNVVRSPDAPTFSEQPAESGDNDSRGKGGVFDSYREALDRARGAREQSESRDRELQDDLQQLR